MEQLGLAVVKVPRHHVRLPLIPIVILYLVVSTNSNRCSPSFRVVYHHLLYVIDGIHAVRGRLFRIPPVKNPRQHRCAALRHREVKVIDQCRLPVGVLLVHHRVNPRQHHPQLLHARGHLDSNGELWRAALHRVKLVPSLLQRHYGRLRIHYAIAIGIIGPRVPPVNGRIGQQPLQQRRGGIRPAVQLVVPLREQRRMPRHHRASHRRAVHVAMPIFWHH